MAPGAMHPCHPHPSHSVETACEKLKGQKKMVHGIGGYCMNFQTNCSNMGPKHAYVGKPSMMFRQT